ncbi:MAG: STAS domain-containing protein [Lewinellaceae bacterium]|nr:STAS domain-containing protein [Saprospiraceae bacterium]MCB9316850.1 STAS domain-containing protein [Lewinellaceae bacterium]MCB9332130.1 STAS domain-containing protein [Lewinellaceae bacterium]
MTDRLKFFIQLQQEALRPKLFSLLKEGIPKKQLRRDLIAGLVVGIIALPLAIAFAIASGVTPDKGLITAVVAGFSISVLSGSRVQIGGPTGAFIPIVYGIVQQYGIDGLIVATFLAGMLLTIMGVARLGSVIKFIPHSLIVGFTTGIAVIIFSSQINDLLGLSIEKVPADFLDKWLVYGQAFHQANLWAIGIGAVTLVLAFVMPKITTKVPGALLAILLLTTVVQVFQLPVDTIETRFGSISTALPKPTIPEVNWSMLRELIRPAFAIAMLGAIESLLSAVVADSVIGGNHRSNTELVAQGAGNMASALFGGIPATGAIARTAANIKNGGRTPIAGMAHALVLLAVMVFAGSWAKLIPLSVLAGILVYVAYNMSEWRTFKAILRGQRSDVVVMLTTFFLTVLFDLTVAIEIGMVLAAFLFIRRMAAIGDIRPVEEQVTERNDIKDPESLERYPIPPGVQVFEINGPLFFGVAHKFKETMRRVSKPPKVIVLRMRFVPTIDETGIHNLREFIKNMQARQVKVLLSGVSSELQEELRDARLLFLVGKKNVFANVGAALRYAAAITSDKNMSHPE